MEQINYDNFSDSYGAYRIPDPRIAELIHSVLPGSGAICNVGAGTGAYEPLDREVWSIEPSRQMILKRQRQSQCIQASAEFLPFADAAFSAAMAILTIHHWRDQAAGVAEMCRIAEQQVFLSWEGFTQPFWLLDYIPALETADVHLFPGDTDWGNCLGNYHKYTVQVPHDCSDGFLCAYWRRPEIYFDDGARDAISGFARLTDEQLQPGLERLQRDLDSGQWQQQHQDLLQREEMDYGYRLIVSVPGNPG